MYWIHVKASWTLFKESGTEIDTTTYRTSHAGESHRGTQRMRPDTAAKKWGDNKHKGRLSPRKKRCNNSMCDTIVTPSLESSLKIEIEGSSSTMSPVEFEINGQLWKTHLGVNDVISRVEYNILL